MATRRLGNGLMAVSMLLAVALGATAANAAEPAKPGATAPAKPGATALLGELWAKLRALSPRAAAAPATPTVTAGIRGAEATESELKPYWKGDREQDPAYRAERQALQAAEELADAGKFAEAARGFEAFLEAHPRSSLAPNALFGRALAHAALGDKARASTGFETFLKQHAQHPLAQDAQRALVALR